MMNDPVGTGGENEPMETVTVIEAMTITGMDDWGKEIDTRKEIGSGDDLAALSRLRLAHATANLAAVRKTGLLKLEAARKSG